MKHQYVVQIQRVLTQVTDMVIVVDDVSESKARRIAKEKADMMRDSEKLEWATNDTEYEYPEIIEVLK